jgi:hypothetical protein
MSASFLSLEGSHVNKLWADRINIDGNIHFRNGFEARDRVRLL